MASHGMLSVCYAPFDYIEREARIVLVGITPGLSQANTAIAAASNAMNSGADLKTALMIAKNTASFSGAMRNNLVAMLDSIGVAQFLAVQSSRELFENHSTGIHFTSALRYPVFKSLKNYNGTPNMPGEQLLAKMVQTHLAEEARMLPNALWIPLGPKADQALSYLPQCSVINPNHILSGLPHPSGANAERIAVFLGRKAASAASSKTKPAPLLAAHTRLKRQICELFSETAYDHPNRPTLQ